MKYLRIFFSGFVYTVLFLSLWLPVSADTPYVMYRVSDNNVYDCHPQINDNNHVIWESADGIWFSANPRYPAYRHLLEANEFPYRKYTHPQIPTLLVRAGSWITWNRAGLRWAWFSNVRYWWEGRFELIGNGSCVNFKITDTQNITWESLASGAEGIWYWEKNSGTRTRLSNSGCRPQISATQVPGGQDEVYWLAVESGMTSSGEQIFQEIQFCTPGDAALRIRHADGILDYHVANRMTGLSTFHVVFSGFDGSRFQIYRCFTHPSQKYRITSSPYDQIHPRINMNGMIAWQGFDGHDWEIYRSTGPDYRVQQITDNDYDDLCPEINEQNNIVWFAYDGRDYDIYAYFNLVDEVERITDTDGHAVFPKINKNNWVVFEFVQFYHSPWNEYENTREIYIAKPVLGKRVRK